MRLSLLARFSITMFVLMAALGFALAWGIQHELELSALRQAAESAGSHVTTTLGPRLVPSDFQDPLTESRTRELDRLVRDQVLHEHVVRVKLWARSGQLIYSDDVDIIGHQFPKTDELERALAGEITMDVSLLDKPENASERGLRGDQLLEVYVPIRLGDSTTVVGVYEIYEDMARLNPQIDAMRRFVWSSVGFGFLFLYGALFALVRRASRDLVLQQSRNEHLYAEVQAHANELELLNSLGQEIAGSLDLGQVAEVVVTTVAQRFDGFLCGILLYDEAGSDVVTFAASGWGADRVTPGERIPLGRGIIGQAARTRRVQLANDTTNDPNFIPLPGHNVRAEIALPILRKGKLLGVLTVDSPRLNAFTPSDVIFLETLAAQLAPAIESAQLYRNLSDGYEHTLDALVAALDARDKETEGHSRRVVAFSLALAQQIGIPESELVIIRRGALLHDVGKTGVPDSILLKAGPLTPAEWDIMRCHPSWGKQILSSIPFLKEVSEIVFAHHERWDGHGYPRGLCGPEIPLGARIFALADTLDAITTDRPYRQARSLAFARAEIESACGSQLDPRVVQAFRELPEETWASLGKLGQA